MTKRFDVCGIGNGIMDILVRVSDEEFAQTGFQKGGADLVNVAQQRALLEQFKDHNPTLASGGSVANSIFAVAQLGGKAALATSLGDDRYGMYFDQECEAIGIELGNPLTVGETTGTCLVMITPDSERTMRTCLAVSAALSARHIDEEVISASKWIFVEGYLFANQENGHAAIRRALELARRHDCRVAVTLSDEWIVNLHPDFLASVLDASDLIFANENEACSLTGTSSREQAFEAACKRYKNFLMTAGEQGAQMYFDGRSANIPAFACKPVDLTGAGDIFAGAFLYGITQGIAPESAVRGGCFLASKVISRIGARLHTGTREHWDEALKN
ncbi:MAG: adenosine kinase [Deltaproteobacteria bacterium]|nr:adenosine kinase [Deltaproteobacteria bacterium]